MKLLVSSSKQERLELFSVITAYLTNPFIHVSMSSQYGATTCCDIGNVSWFQLVNEVLKLMSPLLLTCGLTYTHNTLIKYDDTNIGSGDVEWSYSKRWWQNERTSTIINTSEFPSTVPQINEWNDWWMVWKTTVSYATVIPQYVPVLFVTPNRRPDCEQVNPEETAILS